MRLIRLVAPALLLLACKQPLGARCQIDSDCASGLVCSSADPKTCRVSGTELPDAAPLPDGRLFDAAPASVDAAPADAAAAVPDAPLPDAS